MPQFRIPTAYRAPIMAAYRAVADSRAGFGQGQVVRLCFALSHMQAAGDDPRACHALFLRLDLFASLATLGMTPDAARYYPLELVA